MPTIINCGICGQQLPQKSAVMIDFEGKWLITCPRCYDFVGTCQTCVYETKCNFSNDHSEPQMVQQTIRQGPMIMNTQVRNPHLVEKHCLSCRCSFDDKGNCCRLTQEADCGHYLVNPELLKS